MAKKFKAVRLAWSISGLAAGMACIIALIQGNGALVPVNVILLGIFGTLFFFCGALGLRLHIAPHSLGTPIRVIILFCLSAGLMGFVCWHVWPQSIVAETLKHKEGEVSQAGQCYLRTAGYFPMPFRNGVVLPTVLANPTQTPVDDVDMMIMKLVYKDDRETEPSLVEGETQQLHIGTCRAKLYLGMKDFNFSPGNHDRLAYHITIFTRYETWTEIVKLWQDKKNTAGQPRYCEEVTVLRGGNEQTVHFRDDECD